MAAEQNTPPVWQDDLDALVARYRRDGFIHVRAVLSPGEVEQLGAAVDHAVALRKRNDTRTLDQKTPYEQSFTQCQYLWEDFPDVRPLTFHPAIGELAAALVGKPRMRLWHDQALYKEAGGRETEAHQDHPYWPIAGRDTITAWIPLMPVDADTGCMGYVPGSQTGDADFIDIFTTPGAGKALVAKQTVPAQFVPCQAGDVIFHDGHTVHMAMANRSDHTRRVYTAIYLADGSRREGERPHPSVDRDAIPVGAVIDGMATPVSWPLAEGRMPQPGPWPEVSSERRAWQIKLGIVPTRDA